jgi:hypothetical protein
MRMMLNLQLKMINLKVKIVKINSKNNKIYYNKNQLKKKIKTFHKKTIVWNKINHNNKNQKNIHKIFLKTNMKNLSISAKIKII